MKTIENRADWLFFLHHWVKDELGITIKAVFCTTDVAEERIVLLADEGEEANIKTIVNKLAPSWRYHASLPATETGKQAHYFIKVA